MQPSNDSQPFGSLLRRHRTSAGLTQEELAERAGLSRRGIADLERGARRSPYADTVDRLAAALGLSESERAELATLSRRAGPSDESSAATAPRAAIGESCTHQQRIFVRREAELEQLRDACDGALRGAGNLVWVAGEPGVGKTALCEQLMLYAASRGASTLVGQCYEEGSLSIPYLPFVDALRSYVRTRVLEQVGAEFGLAASDLRQLIPELGERVDVEPRGPTTPEEDRWRLLTSFCDAFCLVALRQPLVLVLEDVQWADRASLDLLLVLCRRLPGARMLVVGTYRDVEVDRSHPLSAALVELRRVDAFSRISLRGLANEEVRALLAHIAVETR